MSASNAAARKRRAPQNETQPVQNNIRPQQVAPNVNQTGLTLPQVISIIDNRLIKLETFMKDSSTTIHETVPQQQDMQQQGVNADITQWIGEFNNRFEILAEEIGTLKDIVIRLQSYTMDVNKTLLEERINVFSDLNSNSNKVTDNIVLEPITSNNLQIPSLNLQSLVTEELKNI
jgi:hypothetical protein